MASRRWPCLSSASGLWSREAENGRKSIQVADTVNTGRKDVREAHLHYLLPIS
jgi:hypothetical protein